MKRIIALLLTLTMFLSFTLSSSAFAGTSFSDGTRLSDPALLSSIEWDLYSGLIDDLEGEGYFVESISAVYISQEYLDELEYNSKANVFFGYTLDELDAQFGDTRYVFTLGENNETVVQPFEKLHVMDYQRLIRNITIGTGVILICVVVSVAGGPAVSAIFAAAAKEGAKAALIGAGLSAVSAGIVTGVETGDMSQALEAAAIAGSEGFKWGAIGGAVFGGASEAVSLKSATMNGLTMNEAAIIQRESHYPVDVIRNFSSMEQYELCQEYGLQTMMVSGKPALVREIDLDFITESGQTNLERMLAGQPAIDPLSGEAYQLHHIGQEMDSTLAILTRAEHMQNGNDLIWHELGEASQIDRTAFAKIRSNFWSDLAKSLIGE